MKIDRKYTKDTSLQAYPAKVEIEGVEILELERNFVDDSGQLTEIARLDEKGTLLQLPELSVRQINYTCLEPGIVKAWHLHQKQTDVWFVPTLSRLLLGLVDLRDGSVTGGEKVRLVGGAGRQRIIIVPPGVAHGMANPYPKSAELIYLTDHHFDPKDEYRLPWDYFGADFWQLQRS